jgi:hypothetical protein
LTIDFVTHVIVDFLDFAWSWVVPVTYQIDAARRLIHTICSRPLTFNEVIEHFRTLNEDPACTGHLDVLLDVSEADTLPVSSQLGPVVAELGAVRAKVEFGICAIIATRDAMFGMMRMFEVSAGSYFRAIRVFRVATEAQAWLVSQQSAEHHG